MKQILQNLKTGITELVDVSIPRLSKESVLIESKVSVLSKGTEKMLVDFGKSNYLDKAKQQPDKVKEVLNKIKTDGLIETYKAVQSKLDKPIPLGYCNAGVVYKSSCDEFREGDRVISNGHHAEYVCVPKNLCSKIPENVDDESAAFTIIGSIGLQGIRLLKPEIGENIAVIGLGLIGLISIQILKANGCNVLGIDTDKNKCNLAKNFGIEAICIDEKVNPVNYAVNFSNGIGMDGVLITASSSSNDVVHQAAQMSRKRGRIVLVGSVGLDLLRDDFYEKELSFQVSSSYGPGRYDSEYEEKGIDYPIGFVRWTEKRNFDAILNMMKNQQLNIKPLITNSFIFEEALEAYKLLDDPSSLGILLDYKKNDNQEKNTSSLIAFKEKDKQKNQTTKNIGFIGAGSYASKVLIPSFKKNANLHTLVSSGGFNSTFFGNKFNFTQSSSEPNDIFENDDIDTVVIASRHDSHAEFIIESIIKNKNIFVEKPFALSIDELDQIRKCLNQNKSYNKNIMIGFNRRFSRHSKRLKELLELRNKPKSIIYTVNAGAIQKDNWVQDKEIGGGRIIGEACHFIDLIRYYIGSSIISFDAISLGSKSDEISNDKVSFNLTFEDGSFGVIHYLANGAKSFPKERIEIFCDNSIIQIDNFKRMNGYNWPGFKSLNLWKQDKGQDECVKQFIKSIENGTSSPISIHEIFEVSKIAIEIDNIIN
tara:strand:+ start:11610 stop:13730 length:2121 start_codon:yes stop_codon:yes gene_type:complete